MADENMAAESAAATETAEQGLMNAGGDKLQGSTDASSGAGGGSDSNTETKGDGQNEAQADAPASEDQKPEGTDKESDQKTDDKSDAKETEDKKLDQPIADWSKVDIKIPEGLKVDEPTMAAFGDAAVKLGLTPKQAQALVEFQHNANKEFMERLYENGVKELRKDWGSKAKEHQQSVMTLIANVDRELGDNKFSKALSMCGATNFPDVCKGLLYIAQGMSEDSMGRGGAAGLNDRQETAEEALMKEWKKARGES